MIEAARAAARAAADLLVNARPEHVRGKTNPRDLVTEWDQRSEELIRRVLHDTGIPVLGEEGGGDAGNAAQRWLVDPIDGTVNFAHGLPVWSVSIALEEHGVPTLGVVVAPVLGWWFEATAGGGARDGRGNVLRCSQTARLDQALLATGFPYDRATNPDNNFAAWEHMQRRAGACRRLGSASLDLCMVACGWLDGYWESRLAAWDLAAGALIAREAGALVTDVHGAPFRVDAGSMLMATPALHPLILAAIIEASREP